MTSDNISSLFAPDPSRPAGAVLGQGIVQSWNPTTGENTIQVAGGTLVNIPSLTSESANVAAGDVVALAVSGDRLLVLGKVTTPGDPGTVPTWNADLTALAPLATIAAVTTGLTITGATNITTDPGTGAHVVVNDPAYPGQIALYSGNANELTPALIRPILGGANYGVADIHSPILNAGGHYAYLSLEGYDDGHTTAVLSSFGPLKLEGEAAELLGFASGVKIGSDRSAGEYFQVTSNAITDADLSSLTNLFPTFPYYSAYLAASATVATATSTAISWTDDAVSPSSGITRSGSVFTVPTAGRYRVTFQAYWAAIASPAGNRLAQLITGNTIGTGTVLASASEQPSATAASSCLLIKTVRLAAGAEIRTQVSHTQGASMTNGLQGNATGDLSYVQIEWVGP